MYYKGDSQAPSRNGKKKNMATTNAAHQHHDQTMFLMFASNSLPNLATSSIIIPL